MDGDRNPWLTGEGLLASMARGQEVTAATADLVQGHAPRGVPRAVSHSGSVAASIGGGSTTDGWLDGTGAAWGLSAAAGPSLHGSMGSLGLAAHADREGQAGAGPGSFGATWSGPVESTTEGSLWRQGSLGNGAQNGAGAQAAGAAPEASVGMGSQEGGPESASSSSDLGELDVSHATHAIAHVLLTLHRMRQPPRLSRPPLQLCCGARGRRSRSRPWPNACGRTRQPRSRRRQRPTRPARPPRTPARGRGMGRSRVHPSPRWPKVRGSCRAWLRVTGWGCRPRYAPRGTGWARPRAATAWPWRPRGAARTGARGRSATRRRRWGRRRRGRRGCWGPPRRACGALTRPGRRRGARRARGGGGRVPGRRGREAGRGERGQQGAVVMGAMMRTG